MSEDRRKASLELQRDAESTVVKILELEHLVPAAGEAVDLDESLRSGQTEGLLL